MAFNGDVVRVDILVGLEVVHEARCSPGPGAEGTPVVELAGLAVVGEADDALGQAGSVVSLERGGVEERVAPAPGEDLLLPGGFLLRQRRWGGWAIGIDRVVFEGDLEDNRDGVGCVRGERERRFDVDRDGGVGGVVDVADEVLGDGGDAAFGSGRGRDDLPVDGGDVGGDAAEGLAVEEFDDLGTPLGRPDFGGLDGLAIVQDERVGQVGPGIGLGLVVVDGVGGFGVRTDAGAKCGDVEEIEEALVVFRGGELDRRGGCRRLGERLREQESERKCDGFNAHWPARHWWTPRVSIHA